MTRHENGPRKPTAKPDKPPHKPRKPAAATSAPPERQRIAKLMARVGLCSRRDAEAWIVDGRVTLNGEILTSPAQDVGPEDEILVDGKPLPEAEKTRLFLFHKPRGLVTSDHDPEGRETVADYLRETWPDGPRIVTIGRLDINTEGLLLLTNDGGLARVLELPATGWVRRYRVRAKGETDQSVLDRLHDGVSIEGIDYAGIEAKLDRTQGANCWLTMGLREGKNREIKRVLEHIGLEVNRLIRLSFGPFQLLDLPEGKVEEVKTRVLRDQLGEALAAEAGVMLGEEPAPPEAKILTARDIAIDRKRAEHKSGERKPDARPADRTSRDRDAGRDDRKTGGKPFGEKRFGSKPDRDAGARRSSRDAPPETEPRRERPVAGTRKHVSALRTDEATARRSGPRTRIERAATTDRNERTVSVERIVRAAPVREERAARRGAGRFVAREDTSARPERGRGGRDHTSPSAMAKRVRIARSGAAPEGRDAPRREQDEVSARKTSAGKTRSVRPDAVDRPRSDGDARPARKSFGDRPARRGEEMREARRETPQRKPSADRPERTGPRDGRSSGDRPSATRTRDDRAPSPRRDTAAAPRARPPRDDARPSRGKPDRADGRDPKTRDDRRKDGKPSGARPRPAGAFKSAAHGRKGPGGPKRPSGGTPRPARPKR